MQVARAIHTNAEFGMSVHTFEMHKWPKSMEIAFSDCESIGTMMIGALMRTFNSIRVAFE